MTSDLGGVPVVVNKYFAPGQVLLIDVARQQLAAQQETNRILSTPKSHMVKDMAGALHDVINGPFQ